MPAEWREFAAFLRQPVLPQRVTGMRLGSVSSTFKLLALDLLLMAIVLGLIGVATALGFKTPENELSKLRLGPTELAAIIVILPLGEEIAFRCWLSGRAGHMLASLIFIVSLTILVFSGSQPHPILVLGDLVITALLAWGAVFWLRHRQAMGFFARHFAWFYFASSVVFALAHLSNYSQIPVLILLPLVVPQLLVGLVLGYARVTYGLWSDMLLHMIHNGLLIGLVVLQTSM
jgi:hypothetical protein